MSIVKGSRIREYGYGTFIDSTVMTDPVKNKRGQLEFKSKTDSGRVINYMKHEESLALLERKS